MRIHSTLDDVLIENAGRLAQEIQTDVEKSAFYPTRVSKGTWPTSNGFAGRVKTLPKSFGVREHTYSLKRAAVNSPYVCLLDLQEPWQVKEMVEANRRILVENAKWLWDQSMQNDLISLIPNHSIALNQSWPGGRGDRPQFPRRINFWGKVVSPFTTSGAGRWFVNRKYKRAAEQVVLFDKDTVQFLFPDSQCWVGEVMWRNIPSHDVNPNGDTGFFRMLFTYAAKPVRPETGRVITVMPSGLRGWLWYHIWKLFGINP